MGKNLLYLVNQRLPTEKAYGFQIAKTCEAFAESGIEVNLTIPTRKNHITQDFFDYYSIKRNFKIKKLFSPDFYFPGKLDKIAILIKNFLSASTLTLYSIFKKADIIYSRDELPLFFLSFFKKKLIFEAHKFSKKRGLFYKRFKKKKLKIIVISQGLKNEFLKFGFKFENVLVAPDAVDLKEFDINVSEEDAREKLNLPKDKKLIGYIGQLKTMGMEKGIDILMESLKFWPENITLVLVGGSEKDVNFYKDLSQNKGLGNKVIFVGRVKHSLVPIYLKSFDVLVMPFPFNQHYAFYMSPLKLFEYMASKRPIVATDLPTVREILNEQNSILVKPDDSSSLAEAIMKLLNSSELAGKLADNAFEDVKNYTWNKRTLKILDFIREP